VSSHVDGHVPVEHPRHVEPVVFSDVGIETVFRMIRRLHDLTAGSDMVGEEETMCHGDLSPWNTVYGSQGAISLIDRDNAAPGSRSDDVGFATWRFLRLGLPDAPPIERRQLRLIARTYGEWTPADLLDLAGRGQSRHRRVFEERQAARDPGILHLIELGALDDIDNARRWLDQHAVELR
jgi:hypothetical protein